MNVTLLRRRLSIFGIVTGIAISILGLLMFTSKPTEVTPITYYSQKSALSSYTFGADFYTEIYNGIFETNNSINNIADGTEATVQALNSQNIIIASIGNQIYKGIGALVLISGIILSLQSTFQFILSSSNESVIVDKSKSNINLDEEDTNRTELAYSLNTIVDSKDEKQVQ